MFIPWPQSVRMNRGRWYYLDNDFGQKARRWRRVNWETVKPWLDAWVNLKIDQHAPVTLIQWGDVVTLKDLAHG